MYRLLLFLSFVLWLLWVIHYILVLVKGKYHFHWPLKVVIDLAQQPGSPTRNNDRVRRECLPGSNFKCYPTIKPRFVQYQFYERTVTLKWIIQVNIDGRHCMRQCRLNNLICFYKSAVSTVSGYQLAKERALHPEQQQNSVIKSIQKYSGGKARLSKGKQSNLIILLQNFKSQILLL